MLQKINTKQIFGKVTCKSDFDWSLNATADLNLNNAYFQGLRAFRSELHIEWQQVKRMTGMPHTYIGQYKEILTKGNTHKYYSLAWKQQWHKGASMAMYPQRAWVISVPDVANAIAVLYCSPQLFTLCESAANSSHTRADIWKCLVYLFSQAAMQQFHAAYSQSAVPLILLFSGSCYQAKVVSKWQCMCDSEA
jgi:hypothetical protein